MSVTALAAALVGLLGILVAAFGVIAAHLGWISPLAGFALFAFVGLLLCGVLALILGAVGLVRTRMSSHRGGAPQAWAGLLLGLLALAVLILLSPRSGVPAIHDLTTDPDDPPAFVAIAALPENVGRELAYPHGVPETPELQRAAYPELEPILVPLPPAQALLRVRAVADELRWETVAMTEQPGSGEIQVEAIDTSFVFNFADDVAVRIREHGEGSRIDVRSTSRVGRSDLGANAERILAFRDRVLRGVGGT
jgi:uncharacterized protein (DUF1499 family)